MTRNEAIELLKKGEAGLKGLKKAELMELCMVVGERPHQSGLTRAELIAWIGDFVTPRVLASKTVSGSGNLQSKLESMKETCERLGIPFSDTTAEHAGQTTIILIPKRPKDPVDQATEELTEYEVPDVEFIAVPEEGRVFLQIGMEEFSQFEEMSDEEIRQVAESRGLLVSVDDGFIDEHGVLDVQGCRDYLIEDEACANIVRATHTYPCGRAFNYFAESDLDVPAEIGLSLFEWGHMSPLYVAAVPDQHSVVKLQKFLSANGVKANFTFARSWEVWGI